MRGCPRRWWWHPSEDLLRLVSAEYPDPSRRGQSVVASASCVRARTCIVGGGRKKYLCSIISAWLIEPLDCRHCVLIYKAELGDLIVQGMRQQWSTVQYSAVRSAVGEQKVVEFGGGRCSPSCDAPAAR